MAVEASYMIQPGNIKPGGLTLHREVDLMCQLARSIEGICTKLDADGGVTDVNYLALCFTAIFNMAIRDSKDNFVNNFVSADEDSYVSVSPTGLTDKARLHFMYQFHNMLETLTEKLDADAGVTDTGAVTGYKKLCYTDLILHQVEDQKGNRLGNGATFYFRPGGVDKMQLVEWYYNAVNAIETLTEKLDADGGVTDVNYELLWFTAVILTAVENGARSVPVGNYATDRG